MCRSPLCNPAVFAVLAAFASAFPQVGVAQNYPTRPLRLIVGVPPGGTSDTSARIVGPRLAELLGQPVVIENKPGANNGIATEFVARAQPDGCTLLWAFSGGIVVNPVLLRDVRYDPLNDLAPIQLLGTFQFVLVVPRAVAANRCRNSSRSSRHRNRANTPMRRAASAVRITLRVNCSTGPPEYADARRDAALLSRR
jgi:tripartite-type tricarboxylate transporter receptor subunit TctC